MPRPARTHRAAGVNGAGFSQTRQPTFANRAGPCLGEMRPRHICGFPQNISVARTNKGKREIAAGIGYEGRLARSGYGVGSPCGEEGRRKKEKRKRGGEKLDGRIRKRVPRLGRLFVPVSYVSSIPVLTSSSRIVATLALGTPLSALATLGLPELL